MSGYGIHSLVVAEPGSQRSEGPWAVVDALQVARAEADGLERVGDIEASGPQSIDADASLAEAAALMAENRLSHLVAVQPGHDAPRGRAQHVRARRRSRLGTLMTDGTPHFEREAR